MDPLSLFLFSTIAQIAFLRHKEKENAEIVTYNGSCHCKKVQFKVRSTKHLVVWDCDCSICYMKKNWCSLHLFISNN